MSKLSKAFFLNNEVLYWDLSKNGPCCPMSKRFDQTLMRHGIKVHFVKSRSGRRIDDLNNLPKVPKCAYVLYEKKDEDDVIRELIQNDIKRVLFHVLSKPSAKALKECTENGVETVVSCPMNAFGTPICKLHALFF